MLGGISGADQARAAARDLRRIAARDLEREFKRATADAVKPLPDMVRTAASGVLPHRYDAVLSPKIRMRVSTSTAVRSAAGVKVTIYASGKVEHRDVAALNRGTLRHPLFGRRKWWYAQRVSPGMVDRPVEELRGQVIADIDKAADEIAARFNEGK
jgi:hypothetical protein